MDLDAISALLDQIKAQRKMLGDLNVELLDQAQQERTAKNLQIKLNVSITGITNEMNANLAQLKVLLNA